MDGDDEGEGKKSLTDLILEGIQDQASEGDTDEEEGGFLDELFRTENDEDDDGTEEYADDEWAPKDEESESAVDEDNPSDDKPNENGEENQGDKKPEDKKPDDSESDFKKEDKAYDDRVENGGKKDESGAEKGDGARDRKTRGGEKPGEKGGEGGKGGRDALRSGENSAAGGTGAGGVKNSGELNEKEKGSPSSWTNSVGKANPTAAAMSAAMKKMKGESNAKAKKGPALIMALIMSFMGFSFVGMQGATWEQMLENIKTGFDSLSPSKFKRTKSWFSYQNDVANRNIRDCRHKFFNKGEFKMKPDSKWAKKLAKNGIELDSTGTMMKFKNSLGEEFNILPDKAFKKLTPAEIEAGKYKSFTDMYNNDVDFHNAYFDGSKTWRGAMHQWFSKLGRAVFKKMGDLGRNIFKNHNPKSKDAEADVQAKIKNIDSANAGKVVHEGAEIGDDPASTTPGAKATEAGKIKGQEVAAKLKGIASKLSKASSITSITTNLICGIFDLVAAAVILAYAAKAAEAVAEATGFTQGLEMAKTEEGNEHSPVNTLMDDMEKPYTSDPIDVPTGETTVTAMGVPISTFLDMTLPKYTDPATGQKGRYEQVTVEGSASSASPVQAIMERTPVDARKNKETGLYTLTAAIRKIYVIFNITSSAHAICTHARIIASVIGAVSDTVEIVACVATIIFAGGSCWELLGHQLLNIAIGAGVGLVLNKIVEILTPFVERAILYGSAKHFLGKEKGTQLADGIMKMTNAMSMSGGQGPVSISNLSRHFVEQDAYIADYARYQRDTRSPFDITTQYTYLGSIAHKAIIINNSGDTVMAKIRGFGSVVASSFRSLLPGAYAAEVSERVNKTIEYSNENCVELSSVGAVGDEFCNPFVGTDYDTIDDDPADVVNKVDDSLKGGNDEKVEIKEKSDLAKYIAYCNNRQSPIGYVDENISNELSSAGSTGITVLDGGISSIMIVGDVIDIVQNEQKLSYSSLITGASCVQGFEVQDNDFNADTNVQDWSETRYYERYIEDQSLAEAMGLIEEDENPVSNYVAKYYEEHPLDNSEEGILARYSGFTKEHVIAVLDAVEYVNWVAQYDPKDLGPEPIPEPEEQDYQFTDDYSNRTMIAEVVRVYVVTDDRRVRNFAA